MYCELACTTNFSFLRGASHPEEMVERAAELKHRAIGIADCNSLAGVVRAHVRAKELGVRLLVGARIIPSDGPQLILYPRDRAAYARLSRLITLGRRRAPKGECLLTMADVYGHLEGQVVIVAAVEADCAAHLGALMSHTRHATGSVYLAAFAPHGPRDQARLRAFGDLARRCGVPLVATNDVHYHIPQRRMLQDVLVCIREHCTIQRAGHRLFSNAERHLKSSTDMARLFADAPDAIARTAEIVDQCRFNLDELRYEYPDELAPQGMSPMAYLTHLTWKGAKARFPEGLPDKVRGQIEHELTLIGELRYEAYFLTVYDIVHFARSRGILCQGRGSAANSAVCFCIGVTSVDPARIDVLFERFVSKERDEPPDIDVDFEHERREEVIQYIYGKYGRHRAGLTAEVVSYRARSAVREVGKALGLLPPQVDRLARTCDWWDKQVSLERLADTKLDIADRRVQLAIVLSREIAGFPRHLSQHVGGFVITRGDLHDYVPVENAAMADRTVIEWNKDDIEALGMIKVDVLALGMLTCIRKAFEFLWKHEETDRTLATIPAEDPVVYDMICRADTVGVFQIESRAQMSMLPRLRPRCFYDLVIEVSIVRPGPIQGNMVHPYLRRRAGKEVVTFPNEAVRGVLSKTLGVPLFQEQVMKLAVVAAGFTPGEADQLRRAMAAWRRQGIIDRFHQKFVAGMLSNGYSPEFAEQLFNQVRGFGEYGFPESHAASFALLVYVSAWLKCYHPAIFAAALINSLPMGFYAPAQIVRDAREHGVNVLEADVNESDWDCGLKESACVAAENGAGPPSPNGQARTQPSRRAWCVRLGFRLIRGFSEVHARAIMAARAAGPFKSAADLAMRTDLPHAALRRLADADALRSLGLDRRAALWEVLSMCREKRGGEKSRRPVAGPPAVAAGEAMPDNAHANDYPARDGSKSATSLFSMDFPLFHPVAAPALPVMPLAEHVARDYLMTGLSLKQHPVALLRDQLSAEGVATAAQWRETAAGRWLKMAGLIICRQRPDTASGVVFLTLEDETGAASLIVQSKVYEQYRAAIRHASLLYAEGRVERQGEVVHLIVRKAQDRSGWLPGLLVESHDFH